MIIFIALTFKKEDVHEFTVNVIIHINDLFIILGVFHG